MMVRTRTLLLVIALFVAAVAFGPARIYASQAANQAPEVTGRIQNVNSYDSYSYRSYEYPTWRDRDSGFRSYGDYDRDWRSDRDDARSWRSDRDDTRNWRDYDRGYSSNYDRGYRDYDRGYRDYDRGSRDYDRDWRADRGFRAGIGNWDLNMQNRNWDRGYYNDRY